MMNPDEQNLQQNVNLSRYKVDKNRLLLVSIVNILTTLSAIFSMLFYQWIHISFAFGVRSGHQNSIQAELWINLLYATLEDQDYFLSYATIQNIVCREDTFCLAIFYQLDFIGKLCFGIFALGFIVSLYDLWLILRFWCNQVVTKSKFFNEKFTAHNVSNIYRTVFIFATNIVGMTLNYMAMSLIKLEHYNYGVSFWVFFGSLIIFALAVVYQKWKMKKIQKQEMVLGLLEKQKEFLRASKGSQKSQSETFTI